MSSTNPVLPEISLVFTPDDDVLPTFAIRLQRDDSIEYIDLKAITLPGAYKEARDLGYDPTHTLDKRAFWKIPASVRPEV